jgi:hypothetical protein
VNGVERVREEGRIGRMNGVWRGREEERSEGEVGAGGRGREGERERERERERGDTGQQETMKQINYDKNEKRHVKC